MGVRVSPPYELFFIGVTMAAQKKNRYTIVPRLDFSLQLMRPIPFDAELNSTLSGVGRIYSIVIVNKVKLY